MFNVSHNSQNEIYDRIYPCFSSDRCSYTTSEVSIEARAITSWDRGFDADGAQVWGAEKGPYVFARTPWPTANRRSRMKRLTLALIATALLLPIAGPAFSHCEVPCGIYDDKMRLEMIAEHITTIEKSMKQIVELSAAGEKNFNQIVRWTNSKDEHAEQLQHIVHQYFLTQRIKPAEHSAPDDYAKYQIHLELLHKMLVHAMKAKQTTDTAHTDALRKLLESFGESYLGDKG